MGGGASQSCTSPTETLSPVNHLENSSKYWRMEEKQSHLKTDKVEEYHLKKVNRHAKKLGPASSVINKYINAAVER